MQNIVDKRPVALVPGSEGGLNVALRHINSGELVGCIVVAGIDFEHATQFGFGGVNVVIFQKLVGQFDVKASIVRVAFNALSENILGFLVLPHSAIRNSKVQVGIGRRLLTELRRKDTHGPYILSPLDRLPGFVNLSKSEICKQQKNNGSRQAGTATDPMLTGMHHIF